MIDIDEIWVQIFIFLSQSDILSSTLVCKDWKRIAYDNFFWLRFYSQKFGTKRLQITDDQTARELFQKKNRLTTNWKDHNYMTTEIKVSRKQILAISYSERWDVIISGAADKTIRILDVSSQKELAALHHPRGPVNCIQFDSEKMIAGSDHTDLILYDLPSAKFVRRFRCHSGPIFDACMVGDTAITGSRDAIVGIWDLRQCENVSFLRGHTDSVTSLCWDGGNLLLSGGVDRVIKEWDIRTGACIRDIRHHNLTVRSIIRKGDSILSGGEDRYLIDTSYSTGNLNSMFSCPQYVLALVDSEYGLIHNTTSGIQIRTDENWKIPYDEGWFACMDIDPQNRRLFGGSSNGSVLIYDFLPPI